MERTIPQHVQVPNNVIKEQKLDPTDVLVYAHLKNHINSETLEAFPSITTLAKEAGLSRPTVMKAIKHLEENGDISIRKVQLEKRCRSYYKFNTKSKNFEMYGKLFLSEKNITPKEKMYLIVVQPYMFKDLEGFGKVSYTNKELEKLTNIDRNAISSIHKSLEEKDIISVFKTNAKDSETGLKKQFIMYDLTKYHQEFISLKKDVQKNTEDIEAIKQKMSNMEKTINIVLNENKGLKKQLLDKTTENSSCLLVS